MYLIVTTEFSAINSEYGKEKWVGTSTSGFRKEPRDKNIKCGKVTAYFRGSAGSDHKNNYLA